MPDTQLEAAGGDREVFERIALRLVVGAGPNARISFFIYQHTDICVNAAHYDAQQGFMRR